MKLKLLLLLLITNLSLYAQYTTIPDSNFEDKLIARGIDKDGKNGKVKTESISSLKVLNIDASSITDLTGIEDFTSLETLHCFGNKLTSLNVSNNKLLVRLECGSNQLTSLDVSQHLSLETLNCSGNQLTSLDVSKKLNSTKFKLCIKSIDFFGRIKKHSINYYKLRSKFPFKIES